MRAKLIVQIDATEGMVDLSRTSFGALKASCGRAIRPGATNVPGPQQLRQQEKHEEKLRDMREQVAQGKLVIRQMTPDERKRYPPREAGRARAASKRR